MPTIRRQGKRAQRPAPMGEAEERQNVILHLRCGRGYEVFWPFDTAYLAHHKSLTLPVLRREWPEHSARILKEHRDPNTRPHGWWLSEASPAARAEYLDAWRRHYDYDDDYADDDETFTETQARLLRQAGLLEDHIDGNENSDATTDTAALSDMPGADAGLVALAQLQDMPDVYTGDTGNTDTESELGGHP